MNINIRAYKNWAAVCHKLFNHCSKFVKERTEGWLEQSGKATNFESGAQSLERCDLWQVDLVASQQSIVQYSNLAISSLGFTNSVDNSEVRMQEQHLVDMSLLCWCPVSFNVSTIVSRIRHRD